MLKNYTALWTSESITQKQQSTTVLLSQFTDSEELCKQKRLCKICKWLGIVLLWIKVKNKSSFFFCCEVFLHHSQQVISRTLT